MENCCTTPKEWGQESSTVYQGGDKKKIVPICLCSSPWQISSADLPCPQNPPLHFQTSGSCISQTVFLLGGGVPFLCERAVVFLQRNDPISPITQSAQRGALETFTLCTLHISVQSASFQRGQYVNMKREQGNTWKFSHLVFLWRDNANIK